MREKSEGEKILDALEILFQNSIFLKKKLKCIEESKKNKDRRLNIRLASPLIKELEKLSDEEGTSLTYVIEDALCTYIAFKSVQKEGKENK
jgi:predicted DNA binding CopG/RHH family protein